MPFKPLFGVYRILNSENGKSYIGSGNVPARFSEHKRSLRKNQHCNNKLQHAWNKHGEEAFSFAVIEYCGRDRCIALEQAWMDRLDVVASGYNLRPVADSNVGHKWTAGARAKQSQSPITRAKISASLMGRSPSKETRLKLSAASRLRSKEISEQSIRLFKGKSKSPGHRQKLAALNREKALSPEFREKIAASKRGKKRKPFSPEWRAKMSASRLGRKRGPYKKHHEEQHISLA